MAFLGEPPTKVYLYAIAPIKKEEELSRYYGIDYWIEDEFWQQFPGNTFKQTKCHCDLPSKYVLLDTLRGFIQQNWHLNFYGKKAGDKYFYFAAHCKDNYCDPDFGCDLKNIHILTKPDFSAYKVDEAINHESQQTLFQTKYLKSQYNQKERIEKDFWNKHAYSKWQQTRLFEDLPTEYILCTYVGKTRTEMYPLFAKKIDDKYYYLLGTNIESMYNHFYYRPIDLTEIGTKYLDVSKVDYTPYREHEPINDIANVGVNEMFMLSVFDKRERDVEQQKEELEKKKYDAFWHKYPNIIVNEAKKYGYDDCVDVSEIPPEYVPIDRVSVEGNIYGPAYLLYCKKINERHYYLVDPKLPKTVTYNTVMSLESNLAQPTYYDPEFVEFAKSFVDVTKSDMTPFDIDEDIYGGMKSVNYYANQPSKRTQSEQYQKEFWTRNASSHYLTTGDMSNLPLEYVSIGELVKSTDSEFCSIKTMKIGAKSYAPELMHIVVDLYGKKNLDGTYDYLIGPERDSRQFSDIIEYYHPDFVKIAQTYTSATKHNKGPYDESDLVLDNYRFKKYLNKYFLKTYIA